MPLNENAINEILPFAPDAQESSGDVLPLADYKTDTMRARGHQPGIARRDLANRVSRQAAHMAAGIAQFIANRYAAGVKDDSNLDALEAGMLEALWAEITKHDDNPDAHGEAFQALAGHIQDKDDPHATLPPGGETGQVLIKQADGSLAWGSVAGMPVGTLHLSSTGKPSPGSVAANVKQKFTRDLYPQLVARVLADGGYLATEAAWDAAAAANEGSCGRFALTDTHIILPCYRHYFAAAQPGVAGKEVGDWAGDAIRNITGEVILDAAVYENPTGPFEAFKSYTSAGGTTTANATDSISFDASRTVPTADENRPKTSYLLPCIKVADVAVNASQVDMLALVNQVAQINGDKVDKGDAEYRSLVELKGSRSTLGTWTIAELIIGKPLLISGYSDSPDGDAYMTFCNFTECANKGAGTIGYIGSYSSIESNDFTLIPSSTTITIEVKALFGTIQARAYQ